MKRPGQNEENSNKTLLSILPNRYQRQFGGKNRAPIHTIHKSSVNTGFEQCYFALELESRIFPLSHTKQSCLRKRRLIINICLLSKKSLGLFLR